MPGYDWNGNGQNDAFDSYIDMKAMSDSGDGFTDDVSDDFLDDCNESINHISGTSFDEENNEYSWRENYYYDFDHNIDPEDYETEEEYLEALEEAQIDSTSILRQSNVKIRSPYKVGQTVLHDSFGIGNIIAVKPIGQEFLLDIDFQNIGIKQIFTRYAKLTANQAEIEKAKQRNKEITNIKDMQVYNYCKVFVEGVNDQYYYLFDDLELSINNCVEVPFGKENSILAATVVAVGKCLGNALPCDFRSLKCVLRKINSTFEEQTHNPTHILSQDNNIFFEDENICISFVKWERNCYLVGGYATAGTFIFENKSNKRFYVTMRDISVGGFLNRDELPPTILSEKQKEMKTFPFVYENKVPDQEKNNKTVEFKIYYGALRDGYSSKANIIEPTMESDIISIPLCL